MMPMNWRSKEILENERYFIICSIMLNSDFNSKEGFLKIEKVSLRES